MFDPHASLLAVLASELWNEKQGQVDHSCCERSGGFKRHPRCRNMALLTTWVVGSWSAVHVKYNCQLDHDKNNQGPSHMIGLGGYA